MPNRQRSGICRGASSKSVRAMQQRPSRVSSAEAAAPVPATRTYSSVSPPSVSTQIVLFRSSDCIASPTRISLSSTTGSGIPACVDCPPPTGVSSAGLLPTKYQRPGDASSSSVAPGFATCQSLCRARWLRNEMGRLSTPSRCNSGSGSCAARKATATRPPSPRRPRRHRHGAAGGGCRLDEPAMEEAVAAAATVAAATKAFIRSPTGAPRAPGRTTGPSRPQPPRALGRAQGRSRSAGAAARAVAAPTAGGLGMMPVASNTMWTRRCS
mmetsp:Transcript_169756/g.544799  ORF Transcript_169756/g.544799 Transcript_169756/m.544799 type:complete len:269 (+) Transcript_169756:663-1469(+)